MEFICLNNSNYIQTVPAPVKSVVKLPSTCTESGQTDYNAVIEFEGSVYVYYYINTTAPLGHTPGEAVVENEVAPTCSEEGSCDEVVYCSVCGEEVSRDTVIFPVLPVSEISGENINV